MPGRELVPPPFQIMGETPSANAPADLLLEVVAPTGNQPPSIDAPPNGTLVKVTVGTELTIDVTASDPDGHPPYNHQSDGREE